jgi:hypothetical protein
MFKVAVTLTWGEGIATLQIKTYNLNSLKDLRTLSVQVLLKSYYYFCFAYVFTQSLAGGGGYILLQKAKILRAT